MINIRYGRSFSDDTYEYLIDFSKPMTVRQFIDECLAKKGEWGSISINDCLRGPKCDYSHGVILGEPFSEEILNKEVEAAHGNGGWSCSDFVLLVKEPEVKYAEKKVKPEEVEAEPIGDFLERYNKRIVQEMEDELRAMVKKIIREETPKSKEFMELVKEAMKEGENEDA